MGGEAGGERRSERWGEKGETGWAGDNHLLLLPHSCQYLDDRVDTTLPSRVFSYVDLSFSLSLSLFSSSFFPFI